MSTIHSSQHSAVSSQQEERERKREHSFGKLFQDFKTLTLENLYNFDLADGVDGRSGEARRKLRGKLALVKHLSGMSMSMFGHLSGMSMRPIRYV